MRPETSLKEYEKDQDFYLKLKPREIEIMPQPNDNPRATRELMNTQLLSQRMKVHQLRGEESSLVYDLR